MIYQNQCPSVPIFDEIEDKSAMFDSLARQVGAIGGLFGEMTWEPAVKKELQAFVYSGMNPVPTHQRLINYNTRRDLHLLKLCMIRATSCLRMRITLEDYHWAKATLLEAEIYMSSIFREMLIGPDTQIIADTVHFLDEHWEKHKEPMTQMTLLSYLSSRVPSQKVMELLAVMIKAGMITEKLTLQGIRLYMPGDGLSGETSTPKTDPSIALG